MRRGPANFFRAEPGPADQRGFTLIELIAVIAIFLSLAGLLYPAFAKLRDRAASVACVSNLREIGICADLYANDHEQTMPVIEPWPDAPVYDPEDNVKDLHDTLSPYGITQGALKCRADLAGPNYYAREGSSFQWCPMASGQKIQNVKLAWGGGAADGSVPLSSLLMAFDYTNIHSNASNILFGDGHVSAAGN